MESGDKTRLLRDGAVLGLLVPAILTGMGYLRVQAYQLRLGLHDPAALPPLETLALSGMTLVVGPLLGLVVVYLLMWLMVCLKERAAVDPIPLAEVPFLAWLAGGAWLAALFSLTGIGDETPRLVPYSDLTVLDVALLVMGTSFVAILVVMPFVKHPLIRIMAGPTLPGVIVLGLLLFAGLASHAQFQGVDEGSADAWGCREFQGVSFVGAPPPIDANATYLLIAHQDGLYYARDSAQSGTELGVVTVHEDAIQGARLSRVGPIRSC